MTAGLMATLTVSSLESKMAWNLVKGKAVRKETRSGPNLADLTELRRDSN